MLAVVGPAVATVTGRIGGGCGGGCGASDGANRFASGDYRQKMQNF
ncbi:MAG: hypothetical protein GXY06_02710 [Clostridiaceae bacterium]|nr:hypothetical protein [Clostridiaceae bacterium]